ncbi:DUF1707 SHOCT-like domain-containing protein [Rhodococcus sp. ACT016]|uniref:DUF1707 SHOCT-like domain-containing protein n=1 Tax=Rhodococcus sp. ACT016 TaxID=3134808 RepID=UPI003D2C5119
MPNLRSPATRARDVDRAQSCTLLDAAYSDGQLGVDEYEARTATAMRAAMLGDLNNLTADLQIPAHFVGSASTPDAPARRPGLRTRARTAAAMVRGGANYLLFGRGADGDQSGASESLPAQPTTCGEPAEPIDTHTADGIRVFVRRFQQKFRDAIADDVDLYRNDAVVTRMVPGQPHRSHRYPRLGRRPSRHGVRRRQRRQQGERDSDVRRRDHRRPDRLTRWRSANAG